MNKMVVYALFGLFAFVAFSNVTASASWTVEAGEIPYQANYSDRIVIGTVKSASSGFDYTDVVISVDEWLKNPLPRNEITVRTEWGTNAFTSGAAEFSVGEKAILMLKDEDVEKGRFRMLNMELGKHNISDRDAVVKGILSGVTKHIAPPPGGIQALDPEIANPAITKENASSIAAKIIPIPVEKASIALIKDAHRYKIYWEFTYMENAEKHVILEIDAATGEALAYFSYNRPGNLVSITEKQALEKAKYSLMSFGVNTDALELSQPGIELNELLGGKLYQIEWVQHSNGIPVYDGFIRASVDADTGVLISFVKQLHDVSGIGITPGITQNDAIAAVKDFVVNGYDNAPSDVLSAGLEIRPLFQEGIAKGNLTWKITLGDKRSGYNIVETWIDAASGNIISSDRIKGAGPPEERIWPLIAVGALIAVAVVLLVLYKNGLLRRRGNRDSKIKTQELKHEQE